MFVTMSCFSYYSMLLPWKESNDSAETYSLMLTTNWYSLFFDIMTPNSHQNLQMIVLVKWIGINPMGLSATLVEYKNIKSFRISKLSPKPWDEPQNNCKGLTRWTFVSLCPILIYTTDSILQTLTVKPWWLFFKTLRWTSKKSLGINPMVLCAPWYNSYLHIWIFPPNIDNETLITLPFKTVF